MKRCPYKIEQSGKLFLNENTNHVRIHVDSSYSEFYCFNLNKLLFANLGAREKKISFDMKCLLSYK